MKTNEIDWSSTYVTNESEDTGIPTIEKMQELMKNLPKLETLDDEHCNCCGVPFFWPKSRHEIVSGNRFGPTLAFLCTVCVLKLMDESKRHP